MRGACSVPSGSARLDRFGACAYIGAVKALSLLLIVAALGVFFIVRRTPEPTYVAPKLEDTRDGLQVPRYLSREPAAGERMCVLDVEGMCCAGCTTKVHAALLAVEGVQEASVDFVSKSAKTLVRDDIDPLELERALSFDKYSATMRP